MRFLLRNLCVAALWAIAVGLTTAPAAAQSSDMGVGPRAIDKSEFLTLFVGKTVYFELEDGTPWGREYYLPSSQRSVFVFEDGECFEGRWDKIDDRYCFYYRDDASCWLTYWQGDDIIVVSRSGLRQQVARIVESEPLSCEPAVISRAKRPMSRPTG